MKKNYNVFLFFLLCTLCVFFCACRGSLGNDTFIMACDGQFNGVFSPFTCTTIYDECIVNLVHAPLWTIDSEGRQRDGLAFYEPKKEIKDSEGNVIKSIYKFRLKDNARFSDGSPVTADDIIFTIKVVCDPLYVGTSMLASLPIVGLNEYRYDDPDYTSHLLVIKEEAKEHKPSDVEIRVAAEKLAAEHNMDVMSFLRGGKDYASCTQKLLIDEKEEQLKSEYLNALIGRFPLDYTLVPEIAGVRKVDDRTVEIIIDGISCKAGWYFGLLRVVPAAYYNDGKPLKKGRLELVNEKEGRPLGAGAYKFIKFENKIVHLERNPYFYQGEPKISKIKVQEINEINIVDAIARGDVDFGKPPATPETLRHIQKKDLHYTIVERPYMRYVGINENRITDINVRRGLLSLINKESAVYSYCGDLGTLLECPSLRDSWSYPVGAVRKYPFSADSALEYFRKAGYVQVTEKNKKVLKKNGEQLYVCVGIPADSAMNHPLAPLVMQLKIELEKLGGVLEIQDVEFATFFSKLKAREWPMWVAGFQSEIPEPWFDDFFYSSGPFNDFGISDCCLDRLIESLHKTTDMDERKKICLSIYDRIANEAVIMPVYQPKDIYAFNQKVVNIDSIPKDLSPYYTIFDAIERLELL